MKLASAFKAALSLAFVLSAAACAPSNNSVISSSESDSGIIGGTAVPAGSPVHQSTVLIWDTEGGSICTGSILPQNIILTAAHCIGAAPRHHLIVFATSINQITDLQKGFEKMSPEQQQAVRNKIRSFTRPATKTAIHPLWLQPVKEVNGQMAPTSDLALIQFEGSLPAGFKPASFVPTPTSKATDFVKQGAPAVVAGYGVTKNTLHEVKPTDDPKFAEKVKTGEYFCGEDDKTKKEICFREVSEDSGTLHTTPLKMYQRANRSEVVLQQDEGQAACMGDSGGPAYIQVRGQLYLWGVASRVSRGCNGFAIYTDATSAIPWMKQTISAMLAAPETVPVAPGQHGPPAPVRQPHPTQPAKPKFAI